MSSCRPTDDAVLGTENRLSRKVWYTMGRIPSKQLIVCANFTDVVISTAEPEQLNLSDTYSPGEDRCPLPIPPCLSREEMIPDMDILQQVDKKVAKIPKNADSSISSLAKYIRKCSKTDLGRVRAIFYWICQNVEFDIKAFIRNAKRPKAAEFVLRTKVSLCHGYCALFEELCKLCSIPVKTIQGYTKGYRYNPMKPFKYDQPTSHAWNAVYVAGQWCLVDCTWGAGYLDENNHYHRVFENFYFLTNPLDLINTHFPYMDSEQNNSKDWQLLQNPLNLETFSKAVKKTINLLKWKVVLMSHKNAVVPVHYHESIIVCASGKFLTNVCARFLTLDGTVQNQYTMVEGKPSDIYKITVRPPVVGKFRLTVLANTDLNDSTVYPIVSYVILCRTVEKPIHPFPKHHGIWKSRSDYQNYGFAEDVDNPSVLCPKKGYLDVTLKTEIEIHASIKLTFAEHSVSKLDQYIIMENYQHSVRFRANLPYSGFYKLQVCCKNNDDKYDPVLLYLIDCTKECNPDATPFPQVYSSALEYHCELLEPLGRFLSSDTYIEIRFKSKDITKAAVNGKKIEKSKDGIWRAGLKTAYPGSTVRISGTNEPRGRYWVLYEYDIVKGNALSVDKTFVV